MIFDIKDMIYMLKTDCDNCKYISECMADEDCLCNKIKPTIITILEQRLPKNPIEAGCCPTCNENINNTMNYCPNCGQRLKW